MPAARGPRLHAGWLPEILPMGARAARISTRATHVESLGDAPSDGGSIPPASINIFKYLERLKSQGPEKGPDSVDGRGRVRVLGQAGDFSEPCVFPGFGRRGL